MTLPKNFRDLIEEYPEIGGLYKELSENCYNGGPLDRKTAHLIKLGMSIAIHSEGGTHTHVRLAKEAGATDDEIRHVALLALTTLGWPVLGAAWSWINDVL
jgi:alkylhydroperoxidase/carboxymuconolactone decarboxylase family protein YurZ